MTFENFERGESVRQSSNRTFGFVIAAFFALLAFGPLLRGHPVRWWATGVSGLFLIAAIAAPRVLDPLNRWWTALAIVLHKVTSPIALGVIFYVGFAPFGWILRRMGKDFLRLKHDPKASTYWIARQPPGPAPETMTNQF